MTLSPSESRELRNLNALGQYVQAHVLTPLQADFAALWRDVEARLELPPGSIGTTHKVNGDTVIPAEGAPAEKPSGQSSGDPL